MDTDRIIRMYEAGKKEINELRDEQSKITEVLERMEEIDRQINKEVKSFTRSNDRLYRLIKVWKRTHQPTRRKRCEELIQQEDDEIKRIRLNIEQLKREYSKIQESIYLEK